MRDEPVHLRCVHARRVQHFLGDFGKDPDGDLEHGAAIRKSFKFKDYYRTMAFVNALAYVAHAQDHHPDLGVYYDHVVVRYSTHDVGGLSDNDFICAAKAEQLA